MKKNTGLTGLVLLVILVSFCGAPVWAGQGAAGQAEDTGYMDDILSEYEQDSPDAQAVADPVYLFNKAMFVFNDYLYFLALKPAAQGYKAVMPAPVRKCIKNFFNNLLFPVRFVNNILQGEAGGAGDELSAFIANSTVGILGFNDYAQKHMGMSLDNEDLGQTFGTWSIGEGFYLVLPVLGPSTARDALGSVGDMFLNPVNYVSAWELEWGMRAVDTVNRTSFKIGDYEALKAAALDPYVSLRNAYVQNRRAQIAK